MGRVALVMNVMLDGPDVDIAEIKRQINELVNPQTITEKPIAFGLKMLEVILVFDDKRGANTDEIEKKMKSIEGVSSVEPGDVTLIS